MHKFPIRILDLWFSYDNYSFFSGVKIFTAAINFYYRRSIEISQRVWFSSSKIFLIILFIAIDFWLIIKVNRISNLKISPNSEKFCIKDEMFRTFDLYMFVHHSKYKTHIRYKMYKPQSYTYIIMWLICDNQKARDSILIKQIEYAKLNIRNWKFWPIQDWWI